MQSCEFFAMVSRQSVVQRESPTWHTPLNYAFNIAENLSGSHSVIFPVLNALFSTWQLESRRRLLDYHDYEAWVNIIIGSLHRLELTDLEKLPQSQMEISDLWRQILDSLYDLGLPFRPSAYLGIGTTKVEAIGEVLMLIVMSELSGEVQERVDVSGCISVVLARYEAEAS